MSTLPVINRKLSEETTFRMGGFAPLHCLSTRREVEIFFAMYDDYHILGGGSNILVSDKDFTVPFVRYENDVVSYDETRKDEVLVSVSAGKSWDDFVGETVTLGYGTLATLSLIPGSVGASPVQNIGAYGSEVSECIFSVKGYDGREKKWKEFSNEQCLFSYRKSIFQSMKYFLITEVVFVVQKGVRKRPTYGALSAMFQNMSVEDIDPATLRKEVIRIRDSKLPRVTDAPSVGSFFKNPLVSKEKAESLQREFSGMPFFTTGDEIKLAAGWLIEKAGCRDIQNDMFSLYPTNALVVTHQGGATLESLLSYTREIEKRVREVFGISLEMEPEIIS